MPRVHHVKKAQKDNPAVDKGEPYYWWKFRHGGKRYSKTYPKGSQLTQSEYLGRFLEIEESVGDVDVTLTTVSALEDVIAVFEEAASEMEDLRSETEDKHSSVEDAFPNGCPVLDLLEERVSAAEEAQQQLEDARDELQSVLDEAQTRLDEAAKKKAEAATKAGKDADDEDADDALTDDEQSRAANAVEVSLDCPG